MILNGESVAKYLESSGVPLTEEQVQPNGVDMRFEAAYEITKRKWPKENRYVPAKNDGESYFLKPGYYVVEFCDSISIPQGAVGYVVPRSSLIRSGAMLFSALWDSGYSGKGKCGLQVYETLDGSKLVLKKGERIAQLVISEAEPSKPYCGSYQNELPIGVKRGYI